MRMINDDAYYIGRRFGRLLAANVYRERGRDDSYHRKCVCFCDCGNISKVNTSDLDLEKTLSCGCYKKDVAEAMRAMRMETLNGKAN